MLRRIRMMTTPNNNTDSAQIKVIRLRYISSATKRAVYKRINPEEQ